jgi:hypothetical protein
MAVIIGLPELFPDAERRCRITSDGADLFITIPLADVGADTPEVRRLLRAATGPGIAERLPPASHDTHSPMRGQERARSTSMCDGCGQS